MEEIRGGTCLVKENKERSSVEIYEKPVFKKQDSLIFPQEIIEKFNHGRLCVQCSSCHGCK